MLLDQLILRLLIRIIDCQQNAETEHEDNVGLADAGRKQRNHANGQKEIENQVRRGLP